MTAIQVLSTNAVRGALAELVPQFERASGHRAEVAYASTDRMMSRIREGEAADVLIATAAAIGELADQGRVIASSRIDIGSTGVGIAVRRGARKPDISSVEALKRALLDADSVAWTARGASGIHFASIVEQLGIAQQVHARVIPAGLVGEALARGEAEIGAQMVSEILAVPGAELVGPLPAEVQKTVHFSAAVMTATKDREAAQAFIAFLATRDTAQALEASGITPVTSEK